MGLTVSAAVPPGPGYKQTEVGVIPEDWAVKTLSEVVTFLDGLRKPVKESERAKMRGDIPYYGASGIVDFVNAHLFDEDLILLAEDGENIVSRTSRIAFRVSGRTWVNNHAHVLRPNQNVHIGFLVEYLESLNYERFNSGTAQPKLNKAVSKSIPVLFPASFSEQQAIAEALSDADALIEGLEALIAKKRQLREGAAQKLLAPKDDWSVVNLGEISHIKTGGRNNQDKIADGKYPFFVRSEKVERINSYTHDCEAILIPGEGGIGSIFHYINGRFDVHQRVYAITQFRQDVLGKYVYLFMVRHFGAHALRNSVKATVDSLRLPTFKMFEVVKPPTVNEQILIVNILSDMDAEIAALDVKLAKARRVKAGMMQDLLTGRVRLV